MRDASSIELAVNYSRVCSRSWTTLEAAGPKAGGCDANARSGSMAGASKRRLACHCVDVCPAILVLSLG